MKKKVYKEFCFRGPNGNSQQKWESFKTKKEAQKRKSEVEHEIDTGTFIPPASIKIKDFLIDFVDMYGKRKWGLSMYTSNLGLIRNYINPVLGEINVQDVDARMVDKFIATLQKTKAVDCNGRRAKTEFVTPCTIEKICKLMRCAFGQAIRWGMVGRNPFIGATLPKREQRKRAIWDAETIRRALDACEDDRLYLAIHLAFACSLRFGEICGLTWDCLDISDAAIMNGNAFNRLKRNADLPDVVFHSLRHSSTTYKLKLNHGDIKATQGDTGHAQPDMVTEVYSHILDEDRKVNAQRFETGFYSRPDLRGAEKALREEAGCKPTAELLQLLIGLQDKPELVSFLSELVKQKQL